MPLDLSRRGFLGGIIAACAGPAIIRAGVLMPVKSPLVFIQSRLHYADLQGEVIDEFNVLDVFNGDGFRSLLLPGLRKIMAVTYADSASQWADVFSKNMMEHGNAPVPGGANFHKLIS